MELNRTQRYKRDRDAGVVAEDRYGSAVML
jgi:hypothetical protein